VRGGKLVVDGIQTVALGQTNRNKAEGQVDHGNYGEYQDIVVQLCGPCGFADSCCGEQLTGGGCS
jgi:hypothetical protein